jgi:uncharacterized protein
MGFALRLVLLVSVPLPFLAVSPHTLAQPLEQVSVTIAAGERLSSETTLAAELADAMGALPGLQVRTLLGDAGHANLDALILHDAADLAMVSIDALSEAAARGSGLEERLAVVAKLPPQHIHILAPTGIAGLSDLAGKRVNFGPDGSANAIAAARLFDRLGIAVTPISLEGSRGLAQLKDGGIDAIVVAGGKPAPLLAEVTANSGLHLVPVPFAAALQQDYLPTSFGHSDYPQLIAQGASIPSVAAELVLLTRTGHDADTKIAAFVEALFPQLATLQEDDRHPQWRDVNLAATLPGWQRAQAVADWLQAQTSRQHSRQKASEGWPTISAGTALGPATDTDDNNDTESLFEGFMEWQRTRAIRR